MTLLCWKNYTKDMLGAWFQKEPALTKKLITLAKRRAVGLRVPTSGLEIPVDLRPGESMLGYRGNLCGV